MGPETPAGASQTHILTNPVTRHSGRSGAQTRNPSRGGRCCAELDPRFCGDDDEVDDFAGTLASYRYIAAQSETVGKKVRTVAGMKIRKARLGDVGAIFAIRSRVRENHLSASELAERGITKAAFGKWLTQGYGIWLADLDGSAAGFAIAIPGEATLWALFVDPEFEGRGVGVALLRTAEDWLFAKGCNDISLTTGANPDNRAHGFYESHGWHSTGDIENDEVEYIKSNPSLSLFDFG